MIKKLICKIKGHKNPESINVDDIKLLEEGHVEVDAKCKRCGKIENRKVYNPIIYVALKQLGIEPKRKLELINGGKV